MSKPQIPAHWPQQNIDDWAPFTDVPLGLSTLMPNGKELRDCTRSELDLMEQIMGDRLGDLEQAGKALDNFTGTMEELEAWLSSPADGKTIQ